MPYALFLEGNKLRFAYEDESGEYIEVEPANYFFAENTFYRIALTRLKRTVIEPELEKDEKFDPDNHKYVNKYDITYYVQQGDQLKWDSGCFTQKEAARNSALPCQIGGAIADRGFQGTIAEVRIWNTARTEKELFRAFPATEKGLVSWWKFEENQGNLTYDSKSTNHGTRIGATWVKSPNPQGSQLTLYVNGERELTTPDTPLSTESQFAIGTLKEGDSYTDRVLYTYSASKEAGLDFSLQMKAGAGLKSTTQAGIGLASTVEETAVLVGGKHGIEISQGWLNEQQAGVARGTNRLSRMNMMGSWEDPDKIQYAAIGRRYVPRNVGFALVKSKTADIFALRLKHRDPRKRVTVALTMQANPDIPEDWNIITFPMNPRYTKQGTLDGRIGLSPDLKDYPTATDASTDRSYYKPIEAYALKNRIEKEQQQLATDYRDYSVTAVTGMQDLDKRRKSLPSATQMNLFNTYVWTAEGGFFAETQNTMSMKQEVIGSSFSLATMSGAFVQNGVALAKGAVMFELEVLLGGHLNLTSQRTQESETGFEMNVTLDVERDITLKHQYGSDDKLVTRYDAEGNPMKCPGKVDGYRFMTFYLQPDKEHFQDFSKKVIDRIQAKYQYRLTSLNVAIYNSSVRSLLF